jgi:orotate phosphoribosyltransferase
MQDQDMTNMAQEFVQFSLDCGVLKFGSFKTKAGRVSPYFFNAGLFDDGQKLGKLAAFYAQRIQAAVNAGFEFDMLFGPAYKGIPLVAAVSIELARLGMNKPYAFNRKEAKDHGEGGTLVGAPVRGRVLIVDDVISAGTATRESVEIIKAAGGQAVAIALALDRQEKATQDGQDMPYSPIAQLQNRFGITALTVAKLDDLLAYLQKQSSSEMTEHLSAVSAYRERYGV